MIEVLSRIVPIGATVVAIAEIAEIAVQNVVTVAMIEAVGIEALSAIVVTVVTVVTVVIAAGIEIVTVTAIRVLSPALVIVKVPATINPLTRDTEVARPLLGKGRTWPLLPKLRVRRQSRAAMAMSQRLPLLPRRRRCHRLKCRPPMKAPLTDVRMDKWLWSVRLFKTRGLAIAACDNGRVKLAGQTVKPSRSLRVGDVLTVAGSDLTKTVKVLQLIDRRVGAREVPAVMEDLTPQEDYARARERRELDGFTPRAQGTGRPSKRDRRALEQFEQL